jgi:hypothetical protein
VAINSETDFSPIDNEAPLRWLRSVGLVPGNGLGVVRRSVFFALLRVPLKAVLVTLVKAVL